MIPESACIPIPSEITLTAAGFGVHQGTIAFPAVVAAATAGNLIGSLLAYALGRTRAIDRLALVRRADDAFNRHGERAVFLGRLMPLVRSFISVPAGHARVPIRRFIVLTVAGCAIWSAVFVLAGYLSGSAWQAIAGTAGRVSLAAGGVAVLWILLRPRASRATRSRRRSAV
jgi:membrane protein DedA with SNARE-associated domain